MLMLDFQTLKYVLNMFRNIRQQLSCRVFCNIERLPRNLFGFPGLPSSTGTIVQEFIKAPCGFFLACEDFGRMFDNKFPASVFFFFKWRLRRAN